MVKKTNKKVWLLAAALVVGRVATAATLLVVSGTVALTPDPLQSPAILPAASATTRGMPPPAALYPRVVPDTAIGWCARDPALLARPTGPDGRPANYLHTCGSRLYDANGREVRIVGVSWSGIETGSYVPDGLGARNWQDMLDQVVALGYNTIRVPFTNEALEPGRQINHVNFYINPDLEGLTGLEMLDRLVEGARERGLKIILDRHRSAPYADNSLWYDQNVSEERWIADWQMLAKRYEGNDTVIGFDLHNEPHGPATWGTGEVETDWRLAAERAGDAVLAVNPYLLILVEGIQYHEGQQYWWGGNLLGARSAPVRLSLPGRLVYSPHDYGPSVSHQEWFSDPRFPANMPEVWGRGWAYLHHQEIAPVVVGEFGGPSLGEDPDGQWQRSLLAYLQEHGIGAIAWSLTGSWDTGGLLYYNYTLVDQPKQDAYRQHLGAAPLVPANSVPPRPPVQPELLFRQVANGGPGSDASFAFRLINDGAQPLDLTKVEIRYRFEAGEVDRGKVGPRPAGVEVTGAPLEAEIVPAEDGRAAYLSLRFVPSTGQGGQLLEKYLATDTIEVRLRSLTHVEQAVVGRPQSTPQAESARPSPWERLTLHVDGKLVWGRGP